MNQNVSTNAIGESLLVGNELRYDDKRREAVLDLEDTKLHGVVDGGHTLDAVFEKMPQ